MNLRRAILLGALVAASACSTSSDERKPTLAKDIASVDTKLVPNLRRVSEHVYSSAQPHGDEAFREIAALGIRTVITVDGEAPQLEAARRAGVRYVHIPFGYAGVPKERALEIAKAVRSLPGPFLVHCHHGTQRGPAGAAVARLVLDGGTPEEALEQMKAAGLQARYKGLVSSIASFQVPSEADTAACPLPPEAAPPAGLVERMLEADHAFDRIQAGKPHEGDFAHEALLLREHFVEIGRATQERGPDFKARLDAMLDACVALESATNGNQAPAKAPIETVKQACTKCHQAYRD